MRGCLIERSPNRVINPQKDDAKQMKGQETHKQQNMLFSSQEYAEKLQKENLTLMKALAHRNKLVELSGIEIQKLRVNLRNVQEKNLQFAQANSQMLAELNANRDRLKALQHELGCKNVLLTALKMQLKEQTLPCTNQAMKDKGPANASDADCKPFQAHDMSHKDTKSKQTSKKKPSGSSDVKPIHVNEKAKTKRRVSGVIDATIIPEETSQTEDDNVINKKFVVEDSTHSKRQRARRRSTRVDVQETEQTEKLLEIDDDTKEIKETTSLTSRRRSVRLKPEEAEPCKSFDERDEVKETIKRRRVSSRRDSAIFDFQEPEVTETLNADEAGSLVKEESVGSRSEAAEEPSKSSHDTKETNGKRRFSSRRESKMFDFQEPEVTETLNADDARDLVKEVSEAVEPSENRRETKKPTGKRRVSTRRQSTKDKSQTATEETDEAAAITDPSLRDNKIVQECDRTEKDPERESKKKPSAANEETETEGMVKRTSVGRPSRHAAEKVQSYKEVSLKVKMRRNK